MLKVAMETMKVKKVESICEILVHRAKKSKMSNIAYFKEKDQKDSRNIT